MTDQSSASSTDEQAQTTAPANTPVSQAEITATQDAALSAGGITTPSDISPMLTEGAEELHMLVLDLKARVQALEQKAVDAVENYVDGHDALTTVPTNTMVEPDHPLAGDTKTPIDLLGDVVTLIRRHFGADAV